MKVAILAGGMGSRLAEETEIRPKPMVEVGGRPILWHIMRHFDHHGFDRFVIALGYKGDHIKRFFADYATAHSSLRVDLGSGAIDYLDEGYDEKWSVDLIETGRWTNTGGRIKRLRPYLDEETFLLTWGDGVSDVDIGKLVAFHRSHGRLATVTAVHPPARFGQLEMTGDRVSAFTEKPLDQGWINGAFFVLEPQVFDYIDGDDTLWEKEPMERLAAEGELMAFRHGGFWQCMDTLRDKKLLEDLWAAGSPPWRTWGGR
ncbi:MAG: glucose-1-phosphate cytidylyltransferase [Acidimicrobiia bacterium]|nr:glucose-1-phosphate cytidylyltransferase [Acidimicrobiia bacterium]MDH4306677.1 glucose-1-phosphate cytidylyltransferase [Acidimicrobiia bacterium]MDH5294399.1 glucose-1-phosphate cytidylyltransferase [Acidimicrobiia bacterium]